MKLCDLLLKDGIHEVIQSFNCLFFVWVAAFSFSVHSLGPKVSKYLIVTCYRTLETLLRVVQRVTRSRQERSQAVSHSCSNANRKEVAVQLGSSHSWKRSPGLCFLCLHFISGTQRKRRQSHRRPGPACQADERWGCCCLLLFFTLVTRQWSLKAELESCVVWKTSEYSDILKYHWGAKLDMVSPPSFGSYGTKAAGEISACKVVLFPTCIFFCFASHKNWSDDFGHLFHLRRWEMLTHTVAGCSSPYIMIVVKHYWFFIALKKNKK